MVRWPNTIPSPPSRTGMTGRAIDDAIREPLLVLDPDSRVIAASLVLPTFAVMPWKKAGWFELGDDPQSSGFQAWPTERQ